MVTFRALIIALGERCPILALFAPSAQLPMLLRDKMQRLRVSTNHLETMLLSVLHQGALHWFREHTGGL